MAAFSAFAAKVLGQTSAKTGTSFALMFWFLLAPLYTKYNYIKLGKQNIKALHFFFQDLSTPLVIQKREIFNYLHNIKSGVNLKARKHNLQDLLYYGKLSNFKDYYKTADIASIVRSTYAGMLEWALKDHPSSNLLKLCLAKEYIHEKEWFLKAYNVLFYDVLGNQPSIPVKISVFLLT